MKFYQFIYEDIALLVIAENIETAVGMAEKAKPLPFGKLEIVALSPEQVLCQPMYSKEDLWGAFACNLAQGTDLQLARRSFERDIVNLKPVIGEKKTTD